MKSTLRSSLAAVVLLAVQGARAAPPRGPAEVLVRGPRVHLSDLLPEASPDVGGVDLGPSPPPSGTRVVDRATVLEAFRSRSLAAPKDLPETFRVARKMRSLTSAEMQKLAETAIVERLPKGARLENVVVRAGLFVPDGYERVSADVPKPPRKAGKFGTRAVLSFWNGEDVVFQLNLPIDLILDEQAAAPDLARNGPVTLIVRRGLVEISIQGSATIDADVGDMVPVMLRPSGRILRGRLIDKDHVVAMEAS